MFTIKQGDYTVTKSMRMPQRMIERLERLAAENNVTFTQLVLQCLEYALDNMDPASGEESISGNQYDK